MKTLKIEIAIQKKKGNKKGNMKILAEMILEVVNTICDFFGYEIVSEWHIEKG